MVAILAGFKFQLHHEESFNFRNSFFVFHLEVMECEICSTMRKQLSCITCYLCILYLRRVLQWLLVYYCIISVKWKLIQSDRNTLLHNVCTGDILPAHCGKLILVLKINLILQSCYWQKDCSYLFLKNAPKKK